MTVASADVRTGPSFSRWLRSQDDKGVSTGHISDCGYSLRHRIAAFLSFIRWFNKSFLSLAIHDTGRSVPSLELFHCMIYFRVTFLGNSFFSKRFPISRCATKNMFAIFSFICFRFLLFSYCFPQIVDFLLIFWENRNENVSVTYTCMFSWACLCLKVVQNKYC